MEDSKRLNNVILFTADKKLTVLAIKALSLLEERHKYIKQLEQTFIKMGVGDYENSNINYQIDRKTILDFLNDGRRELEQLKGLIN